jgi:uncharacterized membrane-anchored protein
VTERSEIERDRSERTRAFIYLLLVIALGATFLITQMYARGASEGSLALISLLNAVHALLGGVLALLRYYVKRERVFLVVGVTLLGVSILEGHDIIASARPYLSWFGTRVLLGFGFALAWLSWFRMHHLGKPPAFPAKFVYVIAAAITFILLWSVISGPFPRAYLPGPVIPQLQEFLPGLFLVIALIGTIFKGRWRTSPFEHWFVIALCLHLFASVPFMLFSNQPNDFLFTAAHLLAMAGYLAIEIGLFAGMFRMFRRAEFQHRDLSSAYADLQRSQQQASRSLELIKKKEDELNRKISELKVTRKAILNVLDDFDAQTRSPKKGKAE